MLICPRSLLSVLWCAEITSPVLYAQQFFTVVLFKQSFFLGISVPFTMKKYLLSLPIRTTPQFIICRTSAALLFVCWLSIIHREPCAWCRLRNNMCRTNEALFTKTDMIFSCRFFVLGWIVDVFSQAHIFLRLQGFDVLHISRPIFIRLRA